MGEEANCAQTSTMPPFDIRHEHGQTMAEYTVVVAVITAGLVAMFVALAGPIATVIDRIANLIP